MRTRVRGKYNLSTDASMVVGVVGALAGGLRAAGVPVSTSETIDAVAALAELDVTRRSQVRAALRATLLKDDAHDHVFDRLFATLLPVPRRERSRSAPDQAPEQAPGHAAGSTGPPAATERDLGDELADALRRGDADAIGGALEEAVDRWAGITDTPGTEHHHLRRVLRRLDLARVLQRLARDTGERSALERRLDAARAADQVEEVLRRLEELIREHLRAAGGDRPDRDGRPDRQDGRGHQHGRDGDGRPGELSDVPVLRAAPDELTALRAAVRPLARRIATRLGRRRRRARGHLDMRRTIRSSMSSGGVPLTPRLRGRHPTKPDLVVLCDVSGSVARFAPFMLSLLHALTEEFGRVRSWVFIDGIVEVTDALEAAPTALGGIDAYHLLARRGLVAGDGRSDYRRAYAEFLRRWPAAVTGKTTVLVVGDARGHDRAPALAETKEMRRLARRLYWFNPEPRAEWDTGDSAMGLYAAHCTRVFEVSSLRQLGDAVAEIA
ncbi:MAG TPA: VWA domain-containing protein [Streptosporangiaceae bacterium]|nr:VWA domain-containing protein [Streptosporangiaceae bacterium]